MRPFEVLLLTLVCSAALSQAQQKDSLLLHDPVIAEFDSLFQSADSLSIFQLLDSLMKEPEKEKSQVAFRLGYNSNVVAASRTLGFNQFGLAPGASFYHKSGVYADATGYWSPEYDPDYYLTVASGGYMKTVGKRWSFLVEYSHYFYTNHGGDISLPYTNNLGMSNFLEFKPVNLRLDYYFYFGQKNAHRIMPGVSLNLEKRNWRKIKRILFFPSINVLLGSENITTYVTETKAYTTRPAEIVYRINHNLPLYYTSYTETTHTEFGVMNYSLSAPLSIALKGWTLLVNYTYNFPKALPGEDLALTNSGYMSFSVTRFLTLKKG